MVTITTEQKDSSIVVNIHGVSIPSSWFLVGNNTELDFYWRSNNRRVHDTRVIHSVLPFLHLCVVMVEADICILDDEGIFH